MKTRRFYQFGPFQLDPEERLLFREGERVELTPKAVEMLLVLVESQGHLVTKEQLRERLWPDTIVEESNLTFNIGAIRRALGDDRQNGNRLIETVPRRGYRFVAAVAAHEEPDALSSSPEPAAPVEASQPGKTPDAASRHTPTFRTSPFHVHPIALSVALGGSMIAFTAALIAWANRPPVLPRLLDAIPITSDGSDKGVDRLLTDGPRVYYLTTDLNLMMVPAGGGDGTFVGAPDGFEPTDISSDGLQLAGFRRNERDGEPWLWRVGGAAGRLGSLRGQEPSWSADGRNVAYANRKSLWVARADGGDPRKIAQAAGNIVAPTWSPDGTSLRFTVVDLKAQTRILWEVRFDGRNLHQLLPGWNNPPWECCGKWTPDGRYYVFESRRKGRSDIWALPSRPGFLGPKPTPLQVTTGPLSYYSPTPSKDGSKLFVIGVQKRPHLERYNLKRGQFVPYIWGLEATQMDFSRDGKWLAYVSLLDHTVWRCRVDGTERRQLTSLGIEASEPHWSPDGKQIAFMEASVEKRYRLAIVPSARGEITYPVPGRDGQGVPTWSPDGTKIAFGEPMWRHPPTQMALHVYDFGSRLLSTLPGSSGLWTARWSPDGRYIAALRVDPSDISPELRLFDVARQTWQSLVRLDRINEPTWSRDGKYIYFDTQDQQPALYRVRVPDGKLELLTKLQSDATWSGLSPDGSPLISTDRPTTEVYALRVDWP